MHLNFETIIDSSISELKASLLSALESPNLSFAEISKSNNQGIYFVFEGTELLYIGKTGRTGKIRVRELAADFRSHTFNRKLLTAHFRKLNFEFKSLTNDIKSKWIESGLISAPEFTSHQREINQYIRSKFMYKFLPVKDARMLMRYELFAIATLNPPFND